MDNETEEDAFGDFEPGMSIGANIALLSASAVLIIIGFFGNIVICIAFYASRQLRSIPNYFIVSLSIADILLLVSWSIWVATGVMEIVSPDTALPVLTYAALVSNDIMCGSASMFNMAAVSIDRFLAVTHPLTYKVRVTHERAVAAIVVTWFLSAITCVLSWLRILFDKKYNDVIIIFFAVFCDILPLCCMVYSYMKIIFAARIQIRKMKYMSTQHPHASATLAKDFRLAINLLVLVGPQLIFWGSFFAITVYEGFCIDCWDLDPAVSFIIGNMIYLVSVLNPYIFIMVTRDLRKIIKTMLLCRHGNFDGRDATLEDSIRLNNSQT